MNKGASDPKVQGFVSYQCREIELGRWKLKLSDPQVAPVDNDGEATVVQVQKGSGTGTAQGRKGSKDGCRRKGQ